MIPIDQLVGSSLSDVGVTRSENQDAYGEFHNRRSERMWIVADGMGGHAGGVTASRMCIETVGQVFEQGEGSPAELLRGGMEQANRAIYDAATHDPSLYGMGTTGVGVIFEPDGKLWVGWVGDSRAYRFRAGSLERLSDDHSIVEQWVRIGRLTPEEAATHPRRNELARAIGPESSVEVDVRGFDVEPGDVYLLCSDGLCGYLPDTGISEVIGVEEPARATQHLIDIVNREYHSPDNVTVQVIAVPGHDGLLVSQQPHAAAAAGRAEPTHLPGATVQEEALPMANAPNPSNDQSYPRTRRTLVIGVALFIVAVLLALFTWYAIDSQQNDRQASERARVEAEHVAERVAVEEEAALQAEQRRGPRSAFLRYAG